MRLWQLVQKIQKHAVGPAESHDINVIAGSYRGFRGARHGIIFFSNGAIAPEIFRDGREEFVREAIRILVESIMAHAFDGEQLIRRPGVGKSHWPPVSCGLITSPPGFSNIERFFITALA